MIEISEIELTETELDDDQLQNISGACATGGLGGIHFGGGFGGFRGPRFGGFYGGGFGFGGGFSSFVPVQTIAFPVATETVVEQPLAVQTTTTALQTVSCGC